jgi:hypothetical protein
VLTGAALGGAPSSAIGAYQGFKRLYRVATGQEQAPTYGQQLEEAGQAVTGFDKDRFVQNVQSGNYAGATVNVASPILQALAGGRLGRQLEPIESAARTTPEQITNLAGSLTRSQKVDPYVVAERALPDLRQSAAELGVKPTDIKGLKGIRLPEELAQHAIDRVSDEFQSIKAPYGNQVVSGQPIAERLRALAGKYPDGADRQQILAEAAKYDRPLTIDELDTFRVSSNRKDFSFYQKTEAGQIASPVGQQISKTVGNASRDVLYDAIRDMSGQDVMPLKQRESALISFKDKISKAANTAKAKQAQADSTTMLDKIRGRGMSAIEKNDLWQRVFGLSPAEEFTGKISRSLSNLGPAENRPSYSLNEQPRIAGQLPQPSTDVPLNARVNADTPSNLMPAAREAFTENPNHADVYSGLPLQYTNAFEGTLKTSGPIENGVLRVSDPAMGKQMLGRITEYLNSKDFQKLTSAEKTDVIRSYARLKSLFGNGEGRYVAPQPGMTRQFESVERGGIKGAGKAGMAVLPAMLNDQ